MGSFTTRTIGIGTPAYSSPEQLRKDEYDEKTDMYSLGIIMMELYYPFGTRMERARVLSNLREHHKLPDDFAYSLEVRPKKKNQDERRQDDETDLLFFLF